MFDYTHATQLNRIEAYLKQLLTAASAQTAREVKIMANEQDLQDDLDAIKTGVAGLLQQIAALVAAGPGVVTQAQLDALEAEAKGITAAMAPPPAA